MRQASSVFEIELRQEVLGYDRDSSYSQRGIFCEEKKKSCDLAAVILKVAGGDGDGSVVSGCIRVWSARFLDLVYNYFKRHEYDSDGHNII